MKYLLHKLLQGSHWHCVLACEVVHPYFNMPKPQNSLGQTRVLWELPPMLRLTTNLQVMERS